ncbi:hypothetical protein EDD15DRAFT_2378154 [Pisolithus albus]|nr:hypothetical protein EDD15DRAFT_2378154 [Pisolithus albus]
MSILDEDPHASDETPTMLFNDEGGIKTKREWVLETDSVNLNHPLESLASILDEDRDAGDETPDESKPETLHAAGVLSPANATSPRYFTKLLLPHVTLLLVTSAPSTPACLRENPGVAMEELGMLTTECAAPSRPSKKPKRGARASTAKEQPSLHVVHQIKEAGKQTHLWAAKTRETYSRHVRQARSWLQGHFPLEGAPQILAHTEHESEIYSDQGFKNAFERVPNQCSDKALALYLSWRGFQENCSQSTVDGVRAAFKMLWDESDGATFRGSWHHNDARHRWEGNPVLSAEVNDIIASIRHKLSSDGAERTHSGAMKKEYMDRILTWSASQCPLDVPFQYLRLAMMGCRVPPPGEFLSKSMKLTITRCTLAPLGRTDLPLSNGRPIGISPDIPSTNFTSGAHRKGAVLLGNPLPLLPSTSHTRYLEIQRAKPLAFRDPGSTRRALSEDTFFDAYAFVVPEISRILWRKTL